VRPETPEYLVLIDPKWLAPWQVDKGVAGYNAFLFTGRAKLWNVILNAIICMFKSNSVGQIKP
jgi:hypothetical protein